MEMKFLVDREIERSAAHENLSVWTECQSKWRRPSIIPFDTGVERGVDGSIRIQPRESPNCVMARVVEAVVSGHNHFPVGLDQNVIDNRQIGCQRDGIGQKRSIEAAVAIQSDKPAGQSTGEAAEVAGGDHFSVRLNRQPSYGRT